MAALLLSTAHVFADSLQIVLPKIVSIGDTVEIRYIFHSEAKIFGGDFSDSPSAYLNLNTEYEFFKANAADFTVRKAILEKVNAEYTLTLAVIPWRTGYLSIPPFNLNSLVNSSINYSITRKPPVFTPYIITLSPIEVKSLVAKTGNKNFMPQHAPLLMPGTTAFLAVTAISALAVFSILLFTLLHIPKVAHFIRNVTYLYSLKKNSRKSIKRILKLQKESRIIEADKDFAEKLQHILRDFLAKRFSHDFSSVTTAKLYFEFTELCGGELDEHQENTVESLLSIFNRLDYVRFAENAGFLKENEKTNERITITENAVHLIEDFEKEEA